MYLYFPLQCRPSQLLVVLYQLACKLEVRFKVIYLHGVHAQDKAIVNRQMHLTPHMSNSYMNRSDNKIQ